MTVSPRAHGNEPGHAGRRKPRLMLVQDWPEDRAALRARLTAGGYRLDCVPPPQAAERLNAGDYAAVLVDIYAEGHDVFGLSWMAQAAVRACPVFALTDGPASRWALRRIGFRGGLCEASPAADLAARLRALIETAELEQVQGENRGDENGDDQDRDHVELPNGTARL